MKLYACVISCLFGIVAPSVANAQLVDFCGPRNRDCRPLGLPSLGGNSSSMSTSVNPARFRIFIHFGSAGIDVAFKVKLALEEFGFRVHAPDGQADVVGGTGVDFFNDEDLPGASAISQIVNGVLPPNVQQVAPRRQRVVNPPGFIGVWLGIPQGWSLTRPEVGHCVQQRVVPPANSAPSRFKFLVRCYQTEEICLTARGNDEGRKSACTKVFGLSSTGWNPAPGGWYNSWYQYSEEPRPAPFPEVP